jgi:hypothetical protein
MKDRIENISRKIPAIQSTLEADYFHDEIDLLINECEDRADMIENSLLVLRLDIAGYALRYCGISSTTELE